MNDKKTAWVDNQNEERRKKKQVNVASLVKGLYNSMEINDKTKVNYSWSVYDRPTDFMFIFKILLLAYRWQQVP